MRYFIIFLLFCYANLAFGQSTTVYQEDKSGKYYHETELEEAKNSKIETYKMVFPDMTVSFELEVLEEIIRNDSLIKVFEWKETSEGNLERIYEYKGQKFPDYEFTNLDNEPVNLADLKGKPVFIDLWFTSCGPCIVKFPDLNKVAKKYKDEVHFIAITFDSSRDVKKLLKKRPLNFIHLVDAKPFLKEIGQQLYPKNVLLDKSGKVVFIGESFEPLDRKQMEMVIEEALGAE